MIHRLLHGILTSGFEAIRDESSIIDELFQENYTLESQEAEAIKTYFLEKGCSIENGYPRTNIIPPALRITLGDELESQHFLGDTGGMVEDEESRNFGKEILSSIWDHSYNIWVITDHPDVTAYYYEIAKFVILDGLDVLVEDGCQEFRMSGRELAPNANYLPEHLFIRQLMFGCGREFQRISRQIIKEINFVSGIHLDDGADPSDVGNVNTNVTPYVETE